MKRISRLLLVVAVTLLVSACGNIDDSIKDGAVSGSVAKVNTSERNYYINKLKPKIEDIINEFDKAWEEEWKTSFGNIVQETGDWNNVYESMNSLESRLNKVSVALLSLKTNQLKGGTKKDIESFKMELEKAIDLRNSAVHSTRDMIDENDVNSDRLEKAVEYVSESDRNMMLAVGSILSIEEKLDVER